MPLFRLIILLFITGTLSAGTVSFPTFEGSANADEFLSSAREFERIYSSYAAAFSKYYGDATAMTSHLTYPYGEADMGGFPSMYAGLGLGTAFANTEKIKAESDPDVTSSAIPEILPTVGTSINVAAGITDKLDARLAFFPKVGISIPEDLSSDYSGDFKYANVKGELTYHVIKSGFLMPGVSLSGYFNYTEGNVTITANNLSANSYTYTYDYGAGTADATADYTYDLVTTASWRYYGLGAEAKIWYDLMFFYPYLGYGVGLQGGRFDTDINIEGTIQSTVNLPASQGGPVSETSNGFIRISERAYPSVMLHRFMLGFEMKLVFVTLGAETQFNITSKMAGLSIGAAMQF